MSSPRRRRLQAKHDMVLPFLLVLDTLVSSCHFIKASLVLHRLGLLHQVNRALILLLLTQTSDTVSLILHLAVQILPDLL